MTNVTKIFVSFVDAGAPQGGVGVLFPDHWPAPDVIFLGGEQHLSDYEASECYDAHQDCDHREGGRAPVCCRGSDTGKFHTPVRSA